MKVAVITRHGVTNYGSLLQAMATQQAIEQLGHICVIIDYIRDDESCLQGQKTLLKRKKGWNRNFVSRAVYLALRWPESIISCKRFEKERTKHLKMTKRYRNSKQLTYDKPIADVYMTGSDQVWGPVADGTYDSTYCLAFTGESDRRAAYAASFGQADLAKNVVTYYNRLLNRYHNITVREDTAVKLLKKMGINAIQVLDPVLLFDSGFWGRYARPMQIRKYILVYQIHNDRRLGKYALKVAKSMKLPLIRVSASLHQITREGRLIWCPMVDRFLSYIMNAECIITDSFHGTAFAIIFNIPFVEVLPKDNTSTRNVSILKMTGLSNRILNDVEDIGLASARIDYAKVNQIIAEKRTESFNALTRMIEIKNAGKAEE